MKNFTNGLRTLAEEAKAEERKIVGRHRKELSPNQVLAHKAHRAAVHVYHTGQLMWVGLPAILAFEAARPAWARFVETPIANILFGDHATPTHTEAIGTVAQHFFG